MPEAPMPQAYTGSEPYLFVSYRHTERKLAYPIIRRLHEAGFRVWYDEGIHPGTAYFNDIIAEHVEGCTVLLALCSKDYFQSDNCRHELEYAGELGKTIHWYNVKPLADKDIPSGIRMDFRKTHKTDKFAMTDDAFYDKLMHGQDMDKCRRRSAPAPSVKPKSPAPKAAKPAAPKPPVKKTSATKKPFPWGILWLVLTLALDVLAVLGYFQIRDLYDSTSDLADLWGPSAVYLAILTARHFTAAAMWERAFKTAHLYSTAWCILHLYPTIILYNVFLHKTDDLYYAYFWVIAITIAVLTLEALTIPVYRQFWAKLSPARHVIKTICTLLVAGGAALLLTTYLDHDTAPMIGMTVMMVGMIGSLILMPEDEEVKKDA
ncbi:MAG: toll/interleukin-1 receptor domain-containing protein [Oscillospiraceae bacterium]|nr:toll/interleukin-1 receptor domain-containing protein [Oscillospiraceae bacterium]